MKYYREDLSYPPEDAMDLTQFHYERVKDAERELLERVRELKREKGFVLLAHYYQRGTVQEVADFVGDSYQLSVKAMRMGAEKILFAGAYFMVETAKLLARDSLVLSPRKDNLCPMAEMCSPEEVERRREELEKELGERVYVVAYVNTTARTKSVADATCTSSNAVKVVESFAPSPVLFVPDQGLGTYVKKRLEGKVRVFLWHGFCPTHMRLTVEEVLKVKKRYDNAPLFAHPECGYGVLEVADFVGSTAQILKEIERKTPDTAIIATEDGIFHEIRRRVKGVRLVRAGDGLVCPSQKRITLGDVVRSMETEEYEVKIDEEVAERARRALERMVSIVEGGG